MKKNLFLAIFLLLAACGVPQKQNVPVDPYQHLTTTSVLEHCDAPVESYMFPLFGEVYFILRHDNCGGIDDLFTVKFTPELSEFQETAARLLVILYVRHSDESLEYKFLKTHVGHDEEPHAMFFQLIKKDPPKAAPSADATN